jgi:thiol-disulfide isomerase/thioredoxin
MMHDMHGQRGFVGVSGILVVLGLLLVGGIGYAVLKDPMGGAMEKKDAMMEGGEVSKEGEMMMKKEEGAMMEEKGEMMKKEDSMMKGPTDSMEKDGSMKKEDGMMMEGAMYKGAVLAGKSSPLLDFTKADYDAAVKSGKLVALFFYADWCPLCKAEFPKMISAFDAETGSSVVGFRVNYKDGATDADEKALASQFGVAYQHTKVFVKGGKQVLKAPDTWDAARYTLEIAKHR